ncbi:MAG: hypothetical protein SGBAC_008451, partial [Bacillariaceae sp.]
TVRRVLYETGREYPKEDYDRYFRRVYQHFGSPDGYRVLEDAQTMIDTLQDNDSERILLGITSNTPTRHMESVLPMLDSFHNNFQFFTCSQDVGVEKPEAGIFDKSYQQAKFWIPDLQKDEILHIGDSYACDYCGAKAYGFQALMLDRSSHPAVMAYQDWVVAPNYPGKTLEEVQENTITSLEEVVPMLAAIRNEEAEIEKEESDSMKPKVVANEDGDSRQESIKPHKKKPADKAGEVAVKLVVVEDEAEEGPELEVKAEPEVAPTMKEETKPVQAVEEELPASANSREHTTGYAGVDDYTAKFDAESSQHQEDSPSLRFNSLGHIIEDDQSKFVASVENLGMQLQQQYSTESWFDAKSKVTASLYDKREKKGTGVKSTTEPTGARTGASMQPGNWYDNTEPSTKETKKWTSANKSDGKPTKIEEEESTHYFSNLYSNPDDSSNPLEDFRDIKSPPIYGSQKKQWRSANRSDAEPAEAEPLLEAMDRDIASGRHLTNKYAADYSEDDFRDIQSPPIYGAEIKNRRSVKDTESDVAEPLLEDMDHDIARGRHLTNKYADDYSEDDFRDIQSPPIF